MALYFDKLDLSKRLRAAGFTSDQAYCLAIELHSLMENCLNEASWSSLGQPLRRESVVFKLASSGPKSSQRPLYFDKVIVSHRFEENGFSREQSDCLSIEFHELMTRIFDEIQRVHRNQLIQASGLDRFRLALKAFFRSRKEINR